MKRTFRFLAWLLGGVAVTLAIPSAFIGLAYLARDTTVGRYLGMAYGASIYFVVPVGIFVALAMAISSLRERVPKKEEPNQAPEPTR